MYRKNKYKNFTAKEIKPQGWLRRQLEVQAEGLSGNLNKVWPEIKNCSWIGGTVDSWERVPYWLDGYIPLAYLLEDSEKIETAKKYIDGIIAGQKEDGWICPCEDEERSRYDVWVAFLILKVLVVYYECSSDERIEAVVYKALKNLRTHIQNTTLFGWGSARWYECLIPIFWLYERVKEEWLLALAISLYSEGINHKALFKNWYDKEPRDEWNFETHVVNTAMALKSEALISKITEDGDAQFPKKMLSMLDKHHGTAVGHFTGDECLSGTSAIQGTELCGIVEAMYSYEVLFAITGDHYWLDRLEKTAYNALPAAISEDMWTHQYDQLVNQIGCVRFPEDKVIFRTNFADAHIFGLEPNFGCCTANFNQGWPKLALNTYLAYDTGIVSAVLAPSVLKTKVNGIDTEISLETEYPFKNSLEYTVKCEKENSFTFEIHIPRHVKAVSVNGEEVEAQDSIKLNKVWGSKEKISVEFEFETKFITRDSGLTVLERGPLVYSLAIDEEWKMYEYEKDGVERKFPYCDYEIYPKSKWNYGFAEENVSIVEKELGERPFSKTNPPIEIYAEMAEIDWTMKEGYGYLCNEKPNSTVPIGKTEKKKFKPYGCTTLRMTEMPFIK